MLQYYFLTPFVLLAENKYVYSDKLLPFNIKPINIIQKYPHIIELSAFYKFLLYFYFP